ncbi:hypothetical protein ARMGADRAFT_1083404 [Armillaria gallica]|uniref:Uncharacterized protein n=1 Tax=Armillaria gallica TaxID=47427 RepID=A0A2H3D3T0_ARMGA|nr:hypothetical protein ARMGADRAFT_1083404 [Armillaria gallica]
MIINLRFLAVDPKLRRLIHIYQSRWGIVAPNSYTLLRPVNNPYEQGCHFYIARHVVLDDYGSGYSINLSKKGRCLKQAAARNIKEWYAFTFSKRHSPLLVSSVHADLIFLLSAINEEGALRDYRGLRTLVDKCHNFFHLAEFLYLAKLRVLPRLKFENRLPLPPQRGTSSLSTPF